MKQLTRLVLIPATAVCSGLLCAPYALAASCSTNVQDWGGGYQVDVTVKSGDSNLTGWKVEIDFADTPTITNKWSADFSVSGKTVTASNLSWNGAIAAGQSTSFALQGSGAAPTTTCKVISTNGSETDPGNGSTEPPTEPTEPGNGSTDPGNGSTDSGSCPVKLLGWGNATTGGGNATVQTVTSLSELRKLAKDSTPRVLKLSGTFTTGNTPIEIASNKTLIGADKNATIKGGINIKNRSNIIVRNLNILGAGKGKKPVDTIASRGSKNLWFDHLNLTDASDGLLDLTRGTDRVTVSWNKFSYTDSSNHHRLAFLIGGGSTHGSTDKGKNNVTVHHNWFGNLVDQRQPRLLFGKGHIFNNYYTTKGNTYAIGTGSWASALVENNYFNGTHSPHRFQDKYPSFIKATGNVYKGTSGKKDTGLGGSGSNPPSAWTPSYSYSLDDASKIPDMVTSCAGPQ